MSDDEQKITPLTETDWRDLAERREVLEEFIEEANDLAAYETPCGKLAFLDALLEQEVFEPTNTYPLQCMGIILGDVFVEALGFEWVVVEDRYGRDPALRLPGTSIVLYPLTMISKRVERGDVFEVEGLFEAVAEQVERMKSEGC